METHTISGYIPVLKEKRFLKTEISFNEKEIFSIKELESCPEQYILPGLIDSHVHIESSMVLPVKFGNWVRRFGTVACIADPHEIANVMGMDGIRFMIDNAKSCPVKFFFGAPSCVPATPFESSGSEISPDNVNELLAGKSCLFLSEMMNYPGVLYDDPKTIEKIQIARKFGVPLDGHAPLLSGKNLKKYIMAGISTDHECSTLDEAVEKIKQGMKIQIRNGSAARNFDSLHPLIKLYPEKIMFCTDDSHPDTLLNGHIDVFIRRALELGYNIFDLIQIASVNPVKHYNLPIGLLEPGDPADFILVKNLKEFKVGECWINGKKMGEETNLSHSASIKAKNNFYINVLKPEQLKIQIKSSAYKIIIAEDGQLITKEGRAEISQTNAFLSTDTKNDILKLLVLNRYVKAEPALAMISGFGLKNGAIASSVAHDSHNIIALGVDDESILIAVNEIQKHQGALVAVSNRQVFTIPLPFAGLMDMQEIPEMAKQYQNLNQFVNNMGCRLQAPFMTLSFMALLVIPELKLGDRGLFDNKTFSFTDLFHMSEKV